MAIAGYITAAIALMAISMYGSYRAGLYALSYKIVLPNMIFQHPVLMIGYAAAVLSAVSFVAGAFMAARVAH